jgi:hypothetical protein
LLDSAGAVGCLPANVVKKVEIGLGWVEYGAVVTRAHRINACGEPRAVALPFFVALGGSLALPLFVLNLPLRHARLGELG